MKVLQAGGLAICFSTTKMGFGNALPAPLFPYDRNLTRAHSISGMSSDKQ
jgi:hypothetical protein